jgi:hypothetical protein
MKRGLESGVYAILTSFNGLNVILVIDPANINVVSKS